MSKPITHYVKNECDRIFSSIPMLDAMSDTGKREVVAALERNCQDDMHVSLVLQIFQENVANWYNPIAELVKIARETAKSEKAPDGCELCKLPADAIGVDGWTPRWGYFVNGARCICPRGQWLRAKDAEREGTIQ
jgi:hypothetical protein